MSRESSRPRLMIVEDDAIVAAELRQSLTFFGYEVVGSAATGEQAVRMALQAKPDVVLMDITLEHGLDGIHASKRIHDSSDVPVIFLTAHSDPSTLKQAQEAHPAGYLLKPYEDRLLQATVQMALYRHQIQMRQIGVKPEAGDSFRGYGINE